MMRRCSGAVSVALAGLLALGGPALAAPVPEPLDRPATLVRQPDRAAFQAVTAAGGRLVAVGERGLIVLSDDKGASWRQAKVPVSVTLTAVSFPTPTLGWAVGHYGVVLHSRDGGESWVRQLDGLAAARIVADSVPKDGSSPRLGRIVEEGPDKPFLDLFFPTKDAGFIVGAFGLALRTDDGGKSWSSLTLDLPNPDGLHLYAIRAGGDALYIAGEQGLLMRSDDGGRSFRRLSTPYRGSWFTLAADASGGVALAGLRGNAFRSADRGESWQPIELPGPVSVTASGRAPAVNGAPDRLLLANQAGQILATQEGGGVSLSVSPLPLPPLPMPTGLLAAGDGSLVVATLRGLWRVPASGASAAP
ncbi:WD40/YVTN/BNR-like repeat-containing protein [Azospirillum sp. B510]|uniref:WD40/YVTN/BNR-like repeat-containing protein n=1 Tax=Azospirillum sp. (strain B510) TaxID=137722 RepID=UPI0005A6D585|nr:YCF48-related protein [Azospirillum sp. B510]